MKRVLVATTAAIALAFFSSASTGAQTQGQKPSGAGAQTQGQKPSGASPGSQTEAQKPGASADKGQQVTISGCIQREADWRKTNDKGRGGVAGTGVGAGDEFVLTNTSSTGAAAKSAGGAAAYELTGANEKLAAAHVGHRVEVTGMVKPGSASGGPTAGAPPRGTDVVSKDLQLRELEVSGVKMISADCSKQ